MLTVDGEPREFDDPYAAVADELRALPRRAARRACRRSPAARSACSATTSCARPSRPSASRNPDDARHARPGADGLRRAGRLRPPAPRGHDPGERVRRGDDLERAYARGGRPRSPTCASGWPRPVPRARARARASRPSSSRTSAPTGYERGGRARQGVHPRRRRLPGRAVPALERRRARSRRSRSTAACARSTRARTCTSSTSRTSRSPAPRPSRW